jgi:hypothetical protein
MLLYLYLATFVLEFGSESNVNTVEVLTPLSTIISFKYRFIYFRDVKRSRPAVFKS